MIPQKTPYTRHENPHMHSLRSRSLTREEDKVTACKSCNQNTSRNMPPKSRKSNPPSHTRPYHISHPSLGHITGLTYLSPPYTSPTSPTSTSPTSSPSCTASSLSPNTPQCHYIGGLPYALPPTGPYRFRPSRPLPPEYRYGTKANPGIFTKGAAVCPQPGFSGKVQGEENWDENCLQLNVWIPAGERPKGGWPVCVFLHGGEYAFHSHIDEL